MTRKGKLLILIILFFGLRVICTAQEVLGGLRGNMAEVNITPPVGGRLAGHFYEILSTGLHDSLWAKALILEQGKEKFAFVFL